MATRAALTVYDATQAGITPTLVAGVVPDGHKFLNDGHTILLVQNNEAVAHTLTIQTPATAGGMAIAEDAVTIPSNAAVGLKVIGPFDPGIYNQSDGYVYIDYETGEEAHMSLTAIRVTRII